MRAKWISLLLIGLLALVVACGGASTVDETHDETVAAAETHSDGEDHDATAADTHDDGDDDHDATAADAHDDGDDHDAASADGHDEAAELVEQVTKTLNLTLTNFKYVPNVLTVEVGDVVELRLDSDSQGVPHDFTIEHIDADLFIASLPGSGSHEHAAGMDMDAADVHFAMTEDGEGLVYLKLHEAGTYSFFCTVPGHKELGMVGTLEVTAPAAASAR